MKIISSLSVDHLSCGDNTDTPPGYLLSEDDLADFPDEIIPIARYFVGKPLLQALLDVKCLDPILYKVIHLIFFFMHFQRRYHGCYRPYDKLCYLIIDILICFNLYLTHFNLFFAIFVF